jgi:hypothetical protein
MSGDDGVPRLGAAQRPGLRRVGRSRRAGTPRRPPHQTDSTTTHVRRCGGPGRRGRRTAAAHDDTAVRPPAEQARGCGTDGRHRVPPADNVRRTRCGGRGPGPKPAGDIRHCGRGGHDSHACEISAARHTRYSPTVPNRRIMCHQSPAHRTHREPTCSPVNRDGDDRQVLPGIAAAHPPPSGRRSTSGPARAADQAAKWFTAPKTCRRGPGSG